MELPRLQCSACGRAFPVDDWVWRCPCGSVLDVEPFTTAVPVPAGLAGRPATMWRYGEALPVPLDPAVSMGEGMSPLVPAPGAPGVTLKVDFLMPTLSFKDRGAVVLATMAKMAGARGMVVDSSGNAGTAMAAYAARAKLPCEVFVPAGTAGAKLSQVRAHGALAHVVGGDRQAAADAAISAVAERRGWLYASHAYHPYFLHGTKTFAYELWEQTSGHLPHTVVVPVGNGTLVLGSYLGFAELVREGRAEHAPRLVGVQAEACAPVARAFVAGWSEVPPVDAGPTIAEGIAIARPPRGAQVLAAVRATGGGVVTVTDEQARAACQDLAAEGFYVEPTSAVCWAALLSARRGDAGGHAQTSELLAADGVVVPLCGSGLKSPGH